MLYGGMRFFSEFLRKEPDVFGTFKFAQLFCIIAFALGVAEYFIAKKYAQKVDFFTFFKKSNEISNLRKLLNSSRFSAKIYSSKSISLVF